MSSKQPSFQPLTTDRLVLDNLRNLDVQAMFAYRSDPEVSRYQSWQPISLENVAAFIRSNETTVFGQRDTWYQLAIRLATTGELLGDSGLHFTTNKDEAEIGITIAPRHQGKGYATEAVEAVVGLLFGPLKQHRVFGSVDPRNEASARLLEKVGFRREAHFRKNLWFKGEWVDDVIYAVLAEQWGAE